MKIQRIIRDEDETFSVDLVKVSKEEVKLLLEGYAPLRITVEVTKPEVLPTPTEVAAVGAPVVPLEAPLEEKPATRARKVTAKAAPVAALASPPAPPAPTDVPPSVRAGLDALVEHVAEKIKEEEASAAPITAAPVVAVKDEIPDGFKDFKDLRTMVETLRVARVADDQIAGWLVRNKAEHARLAVMTDEQLRSKVGAVLLGLGK